ncbi:MAG: acyltransferase family protein [Alistipes sp.]|nr:acyltransferase family protein [Alistipes sp.]
MTRTIAPHTERVVFLDYLRAFACLMVIIVHASEYFYIGSEHPVTIAAGDDLWIALLNSMLRAAVPLFVMTSSYLLFPVRTDTPTFLKRRFTRVAIPFIVWLLLYAVLPQAGAEWSSETVLANLKTLCFNFPPAAGHLWFMYMLLGLYLLMPMISSWVAGLTKRGELLFIGMWFLTTFVPYLRYSHEFLYGEGLWNEFSLFWYVSGYIGYLVIAHYIRTYIDWSWGKTLAFAVPAFAIGYAVTAGWFYGFAQTIGADADGMIFGTTQMLHDIEISWRFCTPNVALMSIAIFLVFKKITYSKGIVYKVIADISRMSFGMYLMHIFVLNAVFALLSGRFPTPATIYSVGFVTYIVSYLLTKILSYLPKSKYIIG